MFYGDKRGVKTLEKVEYLERFYKRYKATPILMRRAVGTAFSIIDHLQHVDFADLTFTAFAVCAGNRYQELVRPFEQQIELAKVKEEYFVEHLHDFYLQMARKIRKDPIPYFELLAFMHDRVFAIPIIDRDKTEFHVYCAYMNLVVQMGDYIHPNQNDYNEHIVGIKTDGKLICRQEPLPDLDIATYDYERQIFKNSSDFLAAIRRTFSRYGYSISSEAELQKHNMVLRTYDNNILMMIPWINEYTYDLLPERLPDPNCLMPKSIKMDYHPDKKRLAQRRRTLPSNGVSIKVDGNSLIEEIYMKELYHAEAIYMIARVRMKAGDYSVRFNTSTGACLSTFLDATNANVARLHQLLEAATLWVYGSYVLDDDLGKWEDYFDGRIVEKEAIGGKLRAVYGSKKTDKDNLEQNDRTINGFVRKLPAGQKASDEARNRAEKLGFALADGETYVQSFIRSSWVIKGRTRADASAKTTR